MSKCPKCKSEIDQLKTYQERLIYLSIKDGEADYTDNDYIECNDVIFECPECSEVIFRDEQEAIDFLKEAKK